MSASDSSSKPILPPSAQPVPNPGNGGQGGVRPVPIPRAGPPVSASPASVRPVPVGRPVAARPENASPPTATPISVRPSAPSAAASRPAPVAADPSGAVDQDLQQEKATEPFYLALRSAPPWLVSMVVHSVALIVLALLYLPALMDKPIEIEAVYAEKEGEQLIDEVLETVSLQADENTQPLVSEDLVEVEDPLAAPPKVENLVLNPLTASSEIQAPTVGLALSGRDTGRKKALLAAYGGTATTEAAVRAALLWLKRNQHRDGSWSLSGPFSSGGGASNIPAATAMALLAFQGAGHTHKSGEFRKEVDKGYRILLKMQDDEGNFFRDGWHNHRLYTQAQASIAICELYGMTKDPALREPAERALKYCLKAQSPQGGWRYAPGGESDTSVTGWFVMALQSAKMAGLTVPSPNESNIMKFLDTVSHDEGRQYAYRPHEPARNSMTAEGLLCRQYLGWKRTDERLIDGVAILNANPIRWGGDDHNVYYWYYATQVVHHMEGEPWDKWNKVMRVVLPRHQIKVGKERGSWSPSEDQWGAHGGRLYVTCLCTYMLEVYYRHLPIYSYRAVK